MICSGGATVQPPVWVAVVSYLLIAAGFGCGAFISTRVAVGYRSEGAHRSENTTVRVLAFRAMATAVISWLAAHDRPEAQHPARAFSIRTLRTDAPTAGRARTALSGAVVGRRCRPADVARRGACRIAVTGSY